MKYGTAARALAPAAVLRNRRRERADLSGMVVLLDVAWLARIGGMSRVASAGRSAAQTESSRIVVHRRGPCQAVGRHEFGDHTARAITDHNLPVKLPFARVGYAPWVIHFPRPDTADVEATPIYGVSGLDKRQLTQAVVEGRRQAHDLVHVMRHIPGLENTRSTQTAPASSARVGQGMPSVEMPPSLEKRPDPFLSPDQ